MGNTCFFIFQSEKFVIYFISHNGSFYSRRQLVSFLHIQRINFINHQKKAALIFLHKTAIFYISFKNDYLLHFIFPLQNYEMKQLAFLLPKQVVT